MRKINKTISFIRKIHNNINDNIFLHEPSFEGNEKLYVNDAIDSTFVSSIGEYVNKFETDISVYTNTKKAIATVNGTSALQVCLRLAGVKKDDEVITQALSFIATANAISYLNAKPIFLDVDIDTMGLSPNSLKFFLENNAEIRDDEKTYNKTTGKRISACLPMHTFGFICRIDEIIEICKNWNIPVVEDSAEALGSFYKNKSAGSFGLLSAFSFNGNKIITTGGGGMIVTNNENLGVEAKKLTTTSKIPHKWDFSHDQVGYNYRLPNLNAALGCAQLENLNKKKREKAALYSDYQSFCKKSGLELIDVPDNLDWNYWLMSLKFNNLKERNLFLKLTNDQGIFTRPIWNLINSMPMYKNCYSDDLENSKLLQNTIVNIPSKIN